MVKGGFEAIFYGKVREDEYGQAFIQDLKKANIAYKGVIKKNNLPTIIFDEIDSGTSGEIAESIGFLMKEISKKIQILSITHLAQVASKGDSHFKVIKTSNNGNSSTSIIKLSNNDRISEIASMISGKKITNSALNQAQELLK